MGIICKFTNLHKTIFLLFLYLWTVGGNRVPILLEIRTISYVLLELFINI